MKRDLLDEIIRKYRERRKRRLLERRKHGIMNADDKTDARGNVHDESGRFKKKSEAKKELERRLLGKKTTDGRTVKKIRDHVAIRCASRDIHVSNVVETVFHGKRVKNLEKSGRYVYMYRGTMIVLSPDGELITAMYKGKKGKQ